VGKVVVLLSNVVLICEWEKERVWCSKRARNSWCQARPTARPVGDSARCQFGGNGIA
jgi:hypothetical protein